MNLTTCVDRRRTTRPWGAAAMVLVTLGCSAGDTLGAEGRLRASYVDDLEGCSVDCALETPLVVGGDALLEIAGEASAEVTSARSSDPEVVSIRAGYRPGLFRLHGGRAGEVELEFVDRTGTAIDHFSVRALEAVAIVPVFAQPVRATALPTELEFHTFGRDNTRLRGVGALRYDATEGLTVEPWTIADTLQAMVGGTIGQSGFERAHLVGDLSGGTGAVSVRASERAGVSVSVELAQPQVRGVRLDRVAGEGDMVVIRAEIDVANEEPGVFACCRWESTRAATLGCTTFTYRSAPASEPFTVRCDSHGQSAEISVP